MTRRPRIALCLYGQFRTGAYCLPWLTQQYEFANVDVFGHLKAYSTYTNHDDSGMDLSVDQIQHKVHSQFRVKRLEVITRTEEPFHRPGTWHFAPMFSSLQLSVLFCLHHMHQTNETYDYVVAQRTDILLGPTPGNFAQQLESETTETLWTINRAMPCVKGEARGNGIHDVFLMGTPSVMHALVMATSKSLLCLGSRDWQRFQFTGPNVILAEAAHAMNLNVRQMPLALALVRPGSDMTKPAADSFWHHHDYWTKHHKGMQ